MNRRTFLATTPLALSPQLTNRRTGGVDTEDDTENDPLTLEDILITADVLPTNWTLGPIDPSTSTQRDGDQKSTARGVKYRTHPETDERVGSTYARRCFITDSNLPPEAEHLEVALEVAMTAEYAPHDDRGKAIQALHDAAFAKETQNWELSTDWVDVELSPATNRLRQQSIGSLRKPVCTIPADLDLSSDNPHVEVAVFVAPLPWGVAMVTGIFTAPDEMGLTRRFVTRLGNRVEALGRASPPPLEARR